MDSLDSIRERVEVLEQQAKAMEAHTRTVERRLRRWRGIACGVLVLALLSLALPSGKAADTQPRGMADRMATLEKKLTAMDFDDAANEVVITGANLRIVNGLGSTRTTNGLGNLIVGYNEPRPPDLSAENRTGSHNVVVGIGHNFSSFGGVVVGDLNEISGAFAVVSGGGLNMASGEGSAVSGGEGNTASAFRSVVSGGLNNTASETTAVVSGGRLNTANGFASWVSGGQSNTASGVDSAVSGGLFNIASGNFASVSGGQGNTASGERSSVSGGLNRTAPGEFDWAAGPLFADF